jgi:hypothetical protein
MRRDVYATVLPSGDYVLTSTGVTWNVDRAHGDGNVSRISAGERDRSVAVRALRSLAERDGTDTWVESGIGFYCLVDR